MGSNPDTIRVEETRQAPVLEDISVVQKMLSAVSGSILTSLLGITPPPSILLLSVDMGEATPLDVVRVRLQSQPQLSSISTLRTSSFPTSTPVKSATDLGVTACCREVFWISNNAQYCLATSHTGVMPQAGGVGAFRSPSHVTNTSAANCSVEETRRKTFTSTFDGLRKIARNEGITTLWRGLSPTLVMAVPANVIYFTGYDWLRASPRSLIRQHVPDNYAPLAAGSVARVAAAVAVSPIEMFRTRMQAHSGSSATVFADTLRGLADVVSAQGYSSLWRGLTLTMWRDVPFSGLYWWGYEAVRNTLADANERRSRWDAAADGPDTRGRRRRSRSRENLKTTFIHSVIAGATSGAIASVVTTPFDVGKTRQQVFVHSTDSTSPSALAAKARKLPHERLPEERSMLRFLYHILQTEGVRGLFKGWAARCLKVAPACAIMISSYEVGKKMAQRANERTDEDKALA